MSAIKAGDLVVVVRPHPCCGRSNDIGRIFTVGRFYSGLAEHFCGVAYVNGVFQDNRRCVYDLSVLRRIPPLAELNQADMFEEEKV